MVTMYVLIWMLGTRESITIPGIATKEECQMIGERIYKEQNISFWLNSKPPFHCFEYKGVK